MGFVLEELGIGITCSLSRRTATFHIFATTFSENNSFSSRSSLLDIGMLESFFSSPVFEEFSADDSANCCVVVISNRCGEKERPETRHVTCKT